MAEELILTEPDVEPEKVVTSYKVIGLNMHMELLSASGAKGVLVINLKDNLGGFLNHQYEGQDAIDYMKFMNTANFSVNSMQKRILQRLSNEGVIPGTVTGTPE